MVLYIYLCTRSLQLVSQFHEISLFLEHRQLGSTPSVSDDSVVLYYITGATVMVTHSPPNL